MLNRKNFAPSIWGFSAWALAAAVAMFFILQIMQIYRAEATQLPPQAWSNTAAPDGQSIAWLLSSRADTAAAATTAVPEGWTGVAILGIVHAPGNRGHAVLDWPEIGAQTARAGQMLPNGWRVKTIDPQAVIAIQKGKTHRLELPKAQAEETKNITSKKSK